MKGVRKIKEKIVGEECQGSNSKVQINVKCQNSQKSFFSFGL
jgi:hypothetical protein